MPLQAIYRLGLLFAGCYFESAVRNASSLGLYWIGKQDVLQGLLPYVIPVFFGYVYAIDVRNHWSQSRLKNDIMAYVGSTLLIGYPLYIAASFWLAGAGLDETAVKIKIISTVVLAVNLILSALVWRAAAVRGFPTSMPWGDYRRKSGPKAAGVENAESAHEETADAGDSGNVPHEDEGDVAPLGEPRKDGFEKPADPGEPKERP